MEKMQKYKEISLKSGINDVYGEHCGLHATQSKFSNYTISKNEQSV